MIFRGLPSDTPPKQFQRLQCLQLHKIKFFTLQLHFFSILCEERVFSLFYIIVFAFFVMQQGIPSAHQPAHVCPEKKNRRCFWGTAQLPQPYRPFNQIREDSLREVIFMECGFRGLNCSRISCLEVERSLLIQKPSKSALNCLLTFHNI